MVVMAISTEQMTGGLPMPYTWSANCPPACQDQSAAHCPSALCVHEVSGLWRQRLALQGL